MPPRIIPISRLPISDSITITIITIQPLAVGITTRMEEPIPEVRITAVVPTAAAVLAAITKCSMALQITPPPLHRLLPPAIVPFAVQINQDVPRLGAFAGPDDPATFEFIHDARGAGVAQAQAALQE